MKKLKLIYVGTAEIGAPLLQALMKEDRFDVLLVITQVDRPAGRKMELQPSPIKKIATALGAEVFQPDTINRPESLEKINALAPDMVLVFAYGQMLKEALLQLPKYGCLNVHASLLPQYRGATPIQSALLNGERETGISLMQMVKTLDAGPVYAQFRQLIDGTDNSETLHEKLARLAAEKVPDSLMDIADGKSPEPQNEDEATFCQKLQKSDGQINWNEAAQAIHHKIRAFAGWPTSYSTWNSKRLILKKALLDPTLSSLEPGTVFQKGERVLIAAKNGSIQPEIMQLEGKAAQTTNEFIKGYPHFINSKLGAET